MQWLKDWLQNNSLTRYIRNKQRESLYKKRLAEIKKRDPFIYK